MEGFANVHIEVAAKAFFGWLMGLGAGGLGCAGCVGPTDDGSCVFGADGLIFLAKMRCL